ncbi:MAG: hypothetical protein JSS10_02490 [Verrucomicrobia bacterium]|nr:hypothetical protein [Verrucomicrobiota bacterium]
MSAANNVVREFFCVPCKIFYCNGMTTTEGEAQAHAQEIQKLTGTAVELHHNNTTSTDKTVAMGAKLLGGAGLAGYAVASEKKTTEKKAADTMAGLLGLGLALWGIYDYAQIQNEKNASAQQLANKVIQHLLCNPLGDVTLIFHSQGADIGRRALELLSCYKNRIHVVTIGGMVDIPDGFANRVVNFVDDSDMIANVAKATFGELSNAGVGRPITHTRVRTKKQQCKTAACHGSTDYLGSPEVRSMITHFAQPKYFDYPSSLTGYPWQVSYSCPGTNIL